MLEPIKKMKKIKFIKKILKKHNDPLSKRLLNLFIKNIQYKILAVMLGALSWFIVQGEEAREINRKIEVHIEPPPGYVVQGDNIRYKDATLSGSRALLGDFPIGPLQAKIRVQTPGTRRVKVLLTKQHLDVWNNRINLTIHDAYVDFFIDEEMNKLILVKEMAHGLPAEGFMIEKVQVYPPQISVTGLKSIVKDMEYVQTQPIDISGISKTKVFEVPLQFDPTRPIKSSVEAVSVSFQMGEKRINKNYSMIPIEIEPSNRGFEVRPTHVAIDLQGSAGVINFIEPKDLRAFINVSGLALKDSWQEVKVQVKIPPDTSLIETTPEMVMIRNKK